MYTSRVLPFPDLIILLTVNMEVFVYIPKKSLPLISKDNLTNMQENIVTKIPMINDILFLMLKITKS